MVSDSRMVVAIRPRSGTAPHRTARQTVAQPRSTGGGGGGAGQSTINNQDTQVWRYEHSRRRARPGWGEQWASGNHKAAAGTAATDPSRGLGSVNASGGDSHSRVRTTPAPNGAVRHCMERTCHKGRVANESSATKTLARRRARVRTGAGQ